MANIQHMNGMRSWLTVVALLEFAAITLPTTCRRVQRLLGAILIGVTCRLSRQARRWGHLSAVSQGDGQGALRYGNGAAKVTACDENIRSPEVGSWGTMSVPSFAFV